MGVHTKLLLGCSFFESFFLQQTADTNSKKRPKKLAFEQIFGPFALTELSYGICIQNQITIHLWYQVLYMKFAVTIYIKKNFLQTFINM